MGATLSVMADQIEQVVYQRHYHKEPEPRASVEPGLELEREWELGTD